VARNHVNVAFSKINKKFQFTKTRQLTMNFATIQTHLKQSAELSKIGTENLLGYI